MKGQIVKIIAGFYDIVSSGKIYRVRGSGNLRYKKNIPFVGDWVEFEENKFITQIYKRKNLLIRPKVANVDQVVIVMSLKKPDFSSFLLHRFLAIVEFQDITPIILFTKIDLSNISYVQQYQNDGYKVFEINNLHKQINKQFEDALTNKLTVFMGQSGVGKSTTIQNITNVQRKIQKISKFLNRGKHTTRVVEVINYKDIKIIDTPGFSSLSINLNPLQLSKSFQIFKKQSTKCQFNNCLHYKEVDCQIKKMVQNQKISSQKYQDYLKLLQEVLNEK